MIYSQNAQKLENNVRAFLLVRTLIQQIHAVKHLKKLVMFISVADHRSARVTILGSNSQ